MERVMIVEDDLEPSGAKDANGKKIVHSVVIVRASDKVVLGKYQDSELRVTTTSNKKGENKTEESEVSGMEAAKEACRVNGWRVAKY